MDLSLPYPGKEKAESLTPVEIGALTTTAHESFFFSLILVTIATSAAASMSESFTDPDWEPITPTPPSRSNHMQAGPGPGDGLPSEFAPSVEGQAVHTVQMFPDSSMVIPLEDIDSIAQGFQLSAADKAKLVAFVRVRYQSF